MCEPDYEQNDDNGVQAIYGKGENLLYSFLPFLYFVLSFSLPALTFSSASFSSSYFLPCLSFSHSPHSGLVNDGPLNQYLVISFFLFLPCRPARSHRHCLSSFLLLFFFFSSSSSLLFFLSQGYALAEEGRLLAFPNLYQHRVAPFQLTDPSKPGERKILVYFLVDPEEDPIPSTRLVPPQVFFIF